jgi:hypothetical protein
MKVYNIKYNVGKSKYLVNHHDGKSTHRDGSPFFDLAIFSNKRKFEKFLRGLRKNGYAEEQFSLGAICDSKTSPSVASS